MTLNLSKQSINPKEKPDFVSAELKKPIQGPISSFSQSSSNYFFSLQSQQESEQEKGKIRTIQSLQPVFSCQEFQETTLEAFNILEHRLKKEKSLSLTLLDLNGNFVFTNKLGHEHFQGSLNNLNSKNFLTFLLACQKDHFIRQISKITKNGIQVDYFILSKNIKRKYAHLKLNKESNNVDIYHRYLKTLRSRIKPITFSTQNYRTVDGFWNTNLIRNHQSNQFLLLLSQFGTNLQEINHLDLKNDPIIQSLQLKLEQRIDFEHEQEDILKNKIGPLSNSEQSNAKIKETKKYKIIRKLRKQMQLKKNQMKMKENSKLKPIKKLYGGLSVKKYLKQLPAEISQKLTDANLYQCEFFTDMQLRKQRLRPSFKLLIKKLIKANNFFNKERQLKRSKQQSSDSGEVNQFMSFRN